MSRPAQPHWLLHGGCVPSVPLRERRRPAWVGTAVVRGSLELKDQEDTLQASCLLWGGAGGKWDQDTKTLLHLPEMTETSSTCTAWAVISPRRSPPPPPTTSFRPPRTTAVRTVSACKSEAGRAPSAWPRPVGVTWRAGHRGDRSPDSPPKGQPHSLTQGLLCPPRGWGWGWGWGGQSQLPMPLPLAPED